jgi:hypothetical protein
VLKIPLLPNAALRAARHFLIPRIIKRSRISATKPYRNRERNRSARERHARTLKEERGPLDEVEAVVARDR